MSRKFHALGFSTTTSVQLSVFRTVQTDTILSHWVPGLSAKELAARGIEWCFIDRIHFFKFVGWLVKRAGSYVVGGGYTKVVTVHCIYWWFPPGPLTPPLKQLHHDILLFKVHLLWNFDMSTAQPTRPFRKHIRTDSKLLRYRLGPLRRHSFILGYPPWRLAASKHTCNHFFLPFTPTSARK